MSVSEYEAFVRLLESYSSWLENVYNMIGKSRSGYKEVDTFEELMLSFAMEILYDGK